MPFESTLIENPPERVTTDQMRLALSQYRPPKTPLVRAAISLFNSVYKAGLSELRGSVHGDFGVDKESRGQVTSIWMSLERAYQLTDFFGDEVKLRLMSFLGTLDGSEYYGPTDVLTDLFSYKIRIYDRTFGEVMVTSTKARSKSWKYRRLYEGKTVHSATKFRVWFVEQAEKRYADATADGAKIDKFDFLVKLLEKYQDYFMVTYPIICDYNALRPGEKLPDQHDLDYLEILTS